MAVPNTLQMLKSILFNEDNMTITSDAIIEQIPVDKECHVHALGRTATAYFAKASKKKPGTGSNSGKPRERNQNQDPNKKCTHCKRNGHEVLECRTKKKEDEEKAKSSNSGSTGPPAKANIASTQDNTVHLFHALALPYDNAYSGIEYTYTSYADLSANDLTTTWLIDSGASQIMSSHCHWFKSFTPLPKPIKVILGDNSSIPATGHRQILVH